MTKETAKYQHYDFMIVGQGLAGSLLAWSLIQKGVKVCIISDQKLSASRVAAGLINPVTGQRFVLADLTPPMMQWCKTFYHDIESKLHMQVYHEQAMLRLFNNEKERINGQKRLAQENYQTFLSNTAIPEDKSAEHGGIAQHQTAWLDTNTLLDGLVHYFDKHPDVKHIQHQHFNANDIQEKNGKIQWQNYSANKIIFCEGYKLKDNPLFSWLPLQPAHGEIIACKTTKPLGTDIINKSKWLLPTDTHHCKIGATYEPSLLEPTIQDSSKQDLLTFAHELFKGQNNFACIDHQAGIRPTTKDKQPFLGFHPQHEHIGVFNGFGSRGSLLIPWYSRAFTDTLLNHTTIPQEADIQRYQSLCA